MYLKDTEREDVQLTELAHAIDKWWALVNSVIKLRVSVNTGC